MLITLLLATLWLGGNVLATRILLRRYDKDEPRERNMMIATVWMVPFTFVSIFIGAYLAGRDSKRPTVPDKRELPKEFLTDSAPRTIQAGGKSFDIAAHTSLVNGVPLVNWRSFAVWLASLEDDAERNRARHLAYRAWLLHSRDVRGGGALVYEGNGTLVLSSLAPNMVVAIASYIATSRRRIASTLRGLAEFAAERPVVVLIMDSEDAYYQYIAHYYPEEGEFAQSAGVFIDAGCPHFVSKGEDLTYLEATIVHEMTHMSLAHLDLPKWLDEGLAVNVERTLTGTGDVLAEARELREKHLNFWSEERIQEFWSGASFLRADDGNKLSYDLARLLVHQLGADWQRFAKFCRKADRSDGGATAARDVLSVDLGAWVCAFLGIESDERWSPRAEVPRRAKSAKRNRRAT